MNFFGDIMTYEVLAFLTFGIVLFAGFYITNNKKVTKKDTLKDILEGNNDNGKTLKNLNNKKDFIKFKFIDSQISDEQKEKLIPILGINCSRLQNNIDLLELSEQTSVSNIIASSILGLICMLVFCGLGVVSFLGGRQNFGLVSLVIGTLLFYVFKILPIAQIERKVKNRKGQIEKDMPNFLDLLSSITSSGLTLDQSLNKICQNSTGVIEKQFMKVALDTKLNGGNWKKAMEDMAIKNDVEILSDVISDILIATEKGTPIAQVLKDTAEISRKLRINAILSDAKKISIKIIIPMAIFNFLPILGLFVTPMVWEFTKVMSA